MPMSDRPAQWLLDNRDLWPERGTVLDVACGKGRHAILFAQSGLEVHAVDRSAEAVAALRLHAQTSGLHIDAAVLDLETDPPPSLGESLYDAVLVFNYLHRALMPAIKAAVKPGCRLFYETFTTRQAERGHPRNPAFLLRDGELEELVAPFSVLRSRQGDIDGRFVASVIAERPK